MTAFAAGLPVNTARDGSLSGGERRAPPRRGSRSAPGCSVADAREQRAPATRSRSCGRRPRWRRSACRVRSCNVMPSSMPANTACSRRCSSSVRARRISATRRCAASIGPRRRRRPACRRSNSAAVHRPAPRRVALAEAIEAHLRRSPCPRAATRAPSIVRLCSHQQRQRFADGPVPLAPPRAPARSHRSRSLISVSSARSRACCSALSDVSRADLVQLRLPARAGAIIRREERIGRP